MATLRRGARRARSLPKGVLAAIIVPGGPVVGNVYRADIEQYMEGFEVLSVDAAEDCVAARPA